jgi:DNA polymerase-1
VLTAERLVTLLGVRPEQYRDFAALRGDPSDNLPGVRGIGPKTAARLLTAFGDARSAFDDLAAVAEAVGPGVAARLGAPGARATWELNCQVMTMREDVVVDLTGTAGALPFVPTAVRSAFGSLELPWTAATALRVLAGDLSVPVPPAPVEPDWNPPPRRGRYLPPLRKRPVVDQLALF